MPRQVNLPRTAELFEDGRVDDQIDIRQDTPPEGTTVDAGHPSTQEAVPPGGTTVAPRLGVQPSGRVRHDGKITVYLSSAELALLEETRLQLRAEHGVAVDRGRIVRVAVAAAVEDLQTNGADADVVSRLRQP